MGSDGSRAPRRVDVSIVVPTHDTPRVLLHRALTSAVRQEGADLEIVICDDGSSEPYARDLEELLAGFRTPSVPIHLVRHESKLGPSTARNTAVRQAASGEYLFWLDSDDEIDPLALKEMLGTARRTDAELVISRCTVHEAGTVAVRDPARYLDLGRQHAGSIDDPLAQVVFSVQAQLVLRETFLGVGGFDEGYDFAEITQLFLKLADKVGIDQVRLDPHIAYHYHRRRDSHSSVNREQFDADRMAVLKDYAKDHVSLTDEVSGHDLAYIGPTVDGAQHYRFQRADGSYYKPVYHDEFQYQNGR